jgi:hypothetical protein
MSSPKTFRSRRRVASRSPLLLERLERRLPLAGNVTAQLVGSTLVLTGDAAGNELVVASAAGGRLAVFGNATTINGASTTPNPFVTTRAVTSVVANLNAGNDVIGFGNDAEAIGEQLFSMAVVLTPPFDAGALQAAIDTVSGGVTTFTLPGGLTVTTAGGNDAVGLLGNVGGSVAVNLGSAAADAIGNRLVVGYSDVAAYRIGGALSIVGGAQGDFVVMYGTNVGGGVTAALGNGANTFAALGRGATIASMAYTAGTADDRVLLVANLTVLSGVSILTGAGGIDDVYMDEVTAGGNVIINTGPGNDGDFVNLLTSDVRGGVSVATGGGMDYVSVEDSTIGLGLAVSSGAGNDRIFLGFADSPTTPTTVGLNTVVDAGAGNDEVRIDRFRSRYNVFVHLGAGDDALLMIDVSAFAAYVYGGTGTNSLATDASTRSGIRFLRYYQFQFVMNDIPLP